MKMEVINLTPKEQRVLLLFNSGMEPPQDKAAVDEYLQQHDLEPKRQYQEKRDGQDYLVYYFGQCYIEDHIDTLKSMAT